MRSTFKSGRHIYLVLDNGKTGEEREEMGISFLLGEDVGWYLILDLHLTGGDYKWVDCEAKQVISKKDPWVWCKIIRMGVRDLVIRKLGIREPMSFLRASEHAWMDRVNESMFPKSKWHTVN